MPYTPKLKLQIGPTELDHAIYWGDTLFTIATTAEVVVGSEPDSYEPQVILTCRFIEPLVVEGDLRILYDGPKDGGTYDASLGPVPMRFETHGAVCKLFVDGKLKPIYSARVLASAEGNTRVEFEYYKRDEHDQFVLDNEELQPWVLKGVMTK